MGLVKIDETVVHLLRQRGYLKRLYVTSSCDHHKVVMIIEKHYCLFAFRLVRCHIQPFFGNLLVRKFQNLSSGI